jgi:hypothetical protein
VFIPNLRRLSRRRFVSLAAAAAGAAVLGRAESTQATGVVNQVPFFAQGGTGDNSSVNCGPAAVAAAVNFSGVAYPTVGNVRATLGMNGPTSLDQWAWLLDAYGTPWYPTWTREEFDLALRSGHAVVIAAWMADLSVAPDFEQAWSPFWGQSGRYDGYAQGHALTVVGISEDNANYLIHDPNVFPYNGTSYYGDGAPKGAFRQYNANEVWYTIATYASGQGLAVAGPVITVPEATSVKRVRPDQGDLFKGPGGGHAPERGERGLTGVIIPPSQRGVISSASDDGAASDGP